MVRVPKFIPCQIKDFEIFRKNRLDKVDDLLYNIRTEGESNMYHEMKPIDFLKLGYLQGRADFNTESGYIRRVYDIVTNAAKAMGVKPPVIAGGAPRDVLLGCRPKDYDVFFDGSTFSDPSEIDDYLTVFASFVRDQNRDVFTVPPYSSSSYLEAEPSNNGFSVVSLTPSSVGAYGTRAPLQFIMHPGRTILQTVDGFDHDLVKTYYDGTFHVSDDMLTCLKKKRVPTSSHKSYQRLQDWKQRTGYKITVGMPPKYTTGISSKAIERLVNTDEERLREYLRNDAILVQRLNQMLVIEQPVLPENMA